MKRIVEAYLGLLKVAVVLCLAGMVVLVFGNVILRYFFQTGITTSEELARWLFVWMVFLGAILVLVDHGHLGIDFVVNALPRPLRRAALGLAHLLMLAMTWLIISGTWTQMLLNRHTYAPASGFSQSFFFLAGLVFGVSTAVVIAWRLWLIATGRMDRLELHDEETAAIESFGGR